MHDLGPAAQEMTRLVRGVRDDQLGGPTPCPDYTLGDLVEHVHGLALAFRMAADKETFEGGASPGPSGDAGRLPDDWREAISARLDALVAAWSTQDAWQGSTHIAGLEAPAENIGVTAVNELVVHGWDVARASGQTFEVAPETLRPCHLMAEMLSGPQGLHMRGAGFGEPVPVSADAPPMHTIVGANGRDPHWSPTPT